MKIEGGRMRMKRWRGRGTKRKGERMEKRRKFNKRKWVRAPRKYRRRK